VGSVLANDQGDRIVCLLRPDENLVTDPANLECQTQSGRSEPNSL
jgi:hypothetical protein